MLRKTVNGTPQGWRQALSKRAGLVREPDGQQEKAKEKPDMRPTVSNPKSSKPS